MSVPDQQHTARLARRVALVIAGVMLFWLAVQWAGPKFGLGAGIAFAVDFIALGAFVGALVVTYRMWRGRRDD